MSKIKKLSEPCEQRYLKIIEAEKSMMGKT